MAHIPLVETSNGNGNILKKNFNSLKLRKGKQGHNRSKSNIAQYSSIDNNIAPEILNYTFQP